MSSEFSTLQNLTERPLQVVYKGRGKTIPPKGSLTETKDFIAFAKGKFGNFVAELTEQSTVSYVDEQPDTDMFIANMTGDPDAPLSFVVATRKNKKSGLHEDVVEENENRSAQVVEESLGQRHINYEGSLRMGGGETTYTPIGTNTVTKIGRTIRILPLQRVKVPRELGYELLKRDAQRPRHQRGKVIRARPPEAFEPKMSWSNEQKRAWLELADDEFRKNPGKLGQTDAEIRAANPDSEVANALIAQQGHELYARCFMRMVPNNGNPLPDEKDFELYAREQAKLKKHLSAKVTG
jgi:hypothetical protein